MCQLTQCHGTKSQLGPWSGEDRARKHENRGQRLESQAKSQNGQGKVPEGMCQSLGKVISGTRTVFLVPTSPKFQEEKRFQKVMLGISDRSQCRLKRPQVPQPGHRWARTTNWTIAPMQPGGHLGTRHWPSKLGIWGAGADCTAFCPGRLGEWVWSCLLVLICD